MTDLIEGCKVEGEIYLENDNIHKVKNLEQFRKRVGMVFQKPNPFPMSVYDNVAFGPRAHGITKKAALDKIVEKGIKRCSNLG